MTDKKAIALEYGLEIVKEFNHINMIQVQPANIEDALLIVETLKHDGRSRRPNPTLISVDTQSFNLSLKFSCVWAFTRVSVYKASQRPKVKKCIPSSSLVIHRCWESQADKVKVPRVGGSYLVI